MTLQATHITSVPRADFNRTDFEILIAQKGRRVLLETALQCPCKSKSANQQSNCKNCGGTGWVFINKRETRLVLQAMSVMTDYKAWSEESRGTLTVTSSDSEQLTFMDRFTVIDGNSIYNEVLFFRNKSSQTFAYTAYDIKQILYVGYFKGVDQVFQRLNNGVDYIFDKNIIKLINPAIIAVQGEISITIRYIHAPVYYMIEMKRESMESFELSGSEKLIHLPVSGLARRGHYVLTAPNLTGDRLLDNSYALPICGSVPTVYCSGQTIILPPNTTPSDVPLIIPFTNQNSVLVQHNQHKYVKPFIYDEYGVQMDGLITVIDDDNVNIEFSNQRTGVIVI